MAAAYGLADAMFRAERAVLAAEHELEELLGRLYLEVGDFEFASADRTLDVYDVEPSTAAADELLRAGFARVHQHDHPRGRFIRCSCRSKEH